jgi:hypothetical protein
MLVLSFRLASIGAGRLELVDLEGLNKMDRISFGGTPGGYNSLDEVDLLEIRQSVCFIGV